MIGHRLFISAPIGNVFYLYAAIFEIPMYRFIIKPPACCCWGADVSIDIYQLLLLFYGVTKHIQFELLIVKHALSILNSFSTHRRY